MSRSIYLDADGNPIHNIGFNLDELINNLPAGLDRAILRILSFHIGFENAISRAQLMKDLSQIGFQLKDDRPARAMINQLRKKGYLICSIGGTAGGYWMAANYQEYEDFRIARLHNLAMDLLEQEKAMTAAAEKKWGKYSPAKQAAMFLE